MIMLHSVGNNASDWHQHWLSMSLVHFEELCKFIVRRGYKTAHLDDWYEKEGQAEQKDSRTLYLTFDDGYLDNWVYAYPILKKYGLVATVFVNPEFVDPSTTARLTLEDVWEGKAKQEDLAGLGFLNWKEIGLLDSSGVLDVQSHSMSHNYYFKSDTLIDIYEGQDSYHWMPWNVQPERKYNWLTESQDDVITFGHPVFAYGRALGVRQYLPDSRLVQFGENLYRENKHSPAEMLEALKEKLKEFPGRYESDEELEKRYRYELEESKRILEGKLKKRIDYLCWPGGGYNELSLGLAREAGYKASSIASREANVTLDNSGPYKRMRRFGLNSVLQVDGQMLFRKEKRWPIIVFQLKRNHFFFKNYYRVVYYTNLIWYRLFNKKVRK